jgi:type I restriction enzyme M protein
MEACVIICRTSKPRQRKGRVLFVDAAEEVSRERAQSFLLETHIHKIVRAYQEFVDLDGFAKVAALDEIRANRCSLAIPNYVRPGAVRHDGHSGGLDELILDWQKGTRTVRGAMNGLFKVLKEVGLDG